MTLDLLRALVAAPSPSRAEGPATEVIAAFLGGEVRRLGQNIASIRDAGPGPTLLLLTHHDTVPATAAWTRDPHRPTEEGGRLYGLGANDAKSSVAAMATAFRTATLGRGRLIFVSAAEEEVGRGGAEVFLPTLPTPDEAIVGEPTGLRVAVSQNGLLVLECQAHGRAGHAARPHLADNAIVRAARDVVALHSLDWSPDTLAVTIIGGGERHNVIPDRCRYTLDLRTTSDHDGLVSRVRATVESEVTVRSDRFRAVTTPTEARVLSLARAALPESSTFHSPTLSDWAHLRVPAIKWGPGLSEVSHTADEWVELAMVEQAAVAYRSVVERFLA